MLVQLHLPRDIMGQPTDDHQTGSSSILTVPLVCGRDPVRLQLGTVVNHKRVGLDAVNANPNLVSASRLPSAKNAAWYQQGAMAFATYDSMTRPTMYANAAAAPARTSEG